MSTLLANIKNVCLELGLPTPNLSCGAHNPHSPLEWACLEEMVESVEWLVALAEVWGEGEGGRRKAEGGQEQRTEGGTP